MCATSVCPRCETAITTEVLEHLLHDCHAPCPLAPLLVAKMRRAIPQQEGTAVLAALAHMDDNAQRTQALLHPSRLARRPATTAAIEVALVDALERVPLQRRGRRPHKRTARAGTGRSTARAPPPPDH